MLLEGERLDALTQPRPAYDGDLGPALGPLQQELGALLAVFVVHAETREDELGIYILLRFESRDA